MAVSHKSKPKAITSGNASPIDSYGDQKVLDPEEAVLM